MTRILLLVFSVLCHAAFAQSPEELEKSVSQRIDEVLSLKESGQKIDGLVSLIDEFTDECCSPPPEYQPVYERIHARLKKELRLLPDAPFRQESLVRNFLAARRSAQSETEIERANDGLLFSIRKFEIVFHTLKPPEMMGSVKRIFEDYQEIYKGVSEPSGANHFMRALWGVLFLNVEKISFEDPAGLEDDKLLRLLSFSEKGEMTFKIQGDPNEYDINGVVRKAKNPDVPRAAKQPQSQEETLPDSGKSASSVPTSWIAGTIAALLAISGWFFVRKKQAA